MDLNAFRPNGARQWPLSDVVRLTYEDFTEANGAANRLVIGHVPAAGMIVHGFITVATPYAAGFGTTATIDLGDADDPDRYTASPVSLVAAATTALTVPGFVTTGPTDLVAEFAGNMVGLSAGEFLVYYTVIAEHRKNEQILAR